MGNALLQYATILVLTAFVGTEIIAKVPSILHTPLMSGSNAIHGVILVGSMLILGSANTNLEEVLGFLAVILGTLNVVGGFVVTDRMLRCSSKVPAPRKARVEEWLSESRNPFRSDLPGLGDDVPGRPEGPGAPSTRAPAT